MLASIGSDEMKTLMYIHGYGSTGNALKAKKMRDMFPDDCVVANTYDYDRLPPRQLFNLLRDDILRERPSMILGSSMGGYYALCCTLFYEGVVWCVNPVHDILDTIRRVLGQRDSDRGLVAQRLAEYEDFNRSVFCRLHPKEGQLHFALSTDDELLGDHHPLLQRFPQCRDVVWKSQCGHRFYRFDELHDPITQSLLSAPRQQSNG